MEILMSDQTQIPKVEDLLATAEAARKDRDVAIRQQQESRASRRREAIDGFKKMLLDNFADAVTAAAMSGRKEARVHYFSAAHPFDRAVFAHGAACIDAWKVAWREVGELSACARYKLTAKDMRDPNSADTIPAVELHAAWA